MELESLRRRCPTLPIAMETALVGANGHHIRLGAPSCVVEAVWCLSLPDTEELCLAVSVCIHTNAFLVYFIQPGLLQFALLESTDMLWTAIDGVNRKFVVILLKKGLKIYAIHTLMRKYCYFGLFKPKEHTLTHLHHAHLNTLSPPAVNMCNTGPRGGWRLWPGPSTPKWRKSITRSSYRSTISPTALWRTVNPITEKHTNPMHSVFTCNSSTFKTKEKGTFFSAGLDVWTFQGATFRMGV